MKRSTQREPTIVLSVEKNDGLPDLTGAARAAASWARLRRETWSDETPAVPATEAPTSAVKLSPTPVIAPPPVPLVPIASPLLSVVNAPLPVATPLPTVASPSTAPSTPPPAQMLRHVRDGALARARALRVPVMRWVPRVAVAVALLALAGAGSKYGWATATSKSRVAVVVPAPIPVPTTGRMPAGGLRVNSTPAGAAVVVNGKPRGITPLTLADLPAGRYTIELKSSAGTVKRTVTVGNGKTAELDELIFSGWLALYSPFELAITEGDRTLRLDDRNQIMLPPGSHELRLVNRAFGYDTVRQVELKPGELVTLSVKPPLSTMTVTATEAAEVWLDGARIGETPLNTVPVELGTHEIVVKGAAGGERRFTVAVTVNPLTLNVDFSKPAA